MALLWTILIIGLNSELLEGGQSEISLAKAFSYVLAFD